MLDVAARLDQIAAAAAGDTGAASGDMQPSDAGKHGGSSGVVSASGAASNIVHYSSVQASANSVAPSNGALARACDYQAKLDDMAHAASGLVPPACLQSFECLPTLHLHVLF